MLDTRQLAALGCRIHRRPGGVGQLNGGRSHTACGGVDQYRVAGLEPSQVHHRFMGRDEDLGNSRGMHIVQLRRDMHGHAVIDTRKLGIGPTSDDPHHSISNLETRDQITFANHLTGDLQPDDQRVTEIRMAVATRSMCQVRTVHASGIDTYQQIGWAQVWIGSICQFKYVRRAECSDADGFHDQFFSGSVNVALAIAEAVMAPGKPT